MIKLIKVYWYGEFMKYHIRKAYKFRMYQHARKYHSSMANYYWDQIKQE